MNGNSYYEYTVWFAFGTEKPVPLSIAMRILPAAQRKAEPPTSAAIARELGLAVPLRVSQPKDAEGFAARAIAAGFLLDPAIGVNWAEKGLAQWPNDRMLMRAAIRMYEQRAKQLVGAGETALATPYFLKAGQYAKALERDFPDLTGEERQIIANALYNQACGQAIAGESDNALASLRGALRAGFTDLKLLETDPDLENVRGGGEFVQLVNGLRSLVHPPATLDYELQVHPEGAVEFGGHWYKFYSTSLPWHLASFAARRKGATWHASSLRKKPRL